MTDLHPLLAAVVADHIKYREAAEFGRRAAEETCRSHRQVRDAKIANIEAVKRLSAQLQEPSPPDTRSRCDRLTEDLNRISRMFDR